MMAYLPGPEEGWERGVLARRALVGDLHRVLATLPALRPPAEPVFALQIDVPECIVLLEAEAKLLEFFKPPWWTYGTHSEMIELCMLLTPAEAQPAMAMLKTSWPESCARVGFSASSEAHTRALYSSKPAREAGQHELYAYFAPTASRASRTQVDAAPTVEDRSVRQPLQIMLTRQFPPLTHLACYHTVPPQHHRTVARGNPPDQAPNKA